MDLSIPSIQCPVCGSLASNRTPPDFDGLIIRCNGCRDYDVSGTLLNKLRGVSPGDRNAVLRKAHRLAEPGTRASITSACF
jgi:hypothetical protein